MLTSEAIKHFGSATKLAGRLDKCTHQAISQWDECPPYLRQCEIELITSGKLKREPKKEKTSKQKLPCNHHPKTKVS